MIDSLKELVEWARDHRVKPEDLDELIHDLKSGEAATINNGGLHSQIEYLLGCVNNSAAVKVIIQEAIR